jgi:hypothetical protein
LVIWGRKGEIKMKKVRKQNKKNIYLEVLFAKLAEYINLHHATSAYEWTLLVRNHVNAAIGAHYKQTT